MNKPELIRAIESSKVAVVDTIERATKIWAEGGLAAEELGVIADAADVLMSLYESELQQAHQGEHPLLTHEDPA